MKKAILLFLFSLIIGLFCGCRHDEWEQLTPAENIYTTAEAVTTSSPASTATFTESTRVTGTTAAKTTVTTTKAATSAAKAVTTATKATTAHTTQATTLPATTATTAVSPGFSAADEISEVLQLTNRYRKAVLAADLTLDEDLCRAAALRAQECADTGDISHTRPNGNGCETLLDDMGISYGLMGENLAMGQTSAADVCEQWKGSAGHYRNMVNRKYNKIGIGLAVDENNIGYWVQIFTD